MLDRSNIGCADFEEEDGSEILGNEFGEDAFVLPEVGKIAAQSDRRDGVEGAVEEERGTGDAGGREMESMVVHRAEAGEDEGTVGVSFCEFVGAQEGGEVEGLAFDEDGVDGGGLGEAEMTPIGRKDDRSRVKGPGLGLEAAAEKIVEGSEGIDRHFEFLGIEAIFCDKWGDPGPTGGGAHAGPVETGKEGSFDQKMKNGPSWSGFIGSSQPRFAINGFSFEAVRMAVEVVNRLHGGRLPLAWWGEQGYGFARCD